MLILLLLLFIREKFDI